ncbi:uncharacterized protein GVI51_G00297 [Nakaseomyces glabratus]|uniref:Uncharacterized protein n=2 Tax=Candida glabrata TaxID=5478 RepID=Q6FTR2_CANGA|nr:uncharacterized protein CAGL0G00396g [Nakaseomyces glabratus]KAH7586685.1 hypothetical protein J7298_01643 [Nakaseomyces glabratus]KAH7602135.1 hypothetical protein J7295_01650 [Nakaseomyces glabratus]KAH7603135.1 hypothetical protein J7294_01635 [Nakaseomyces glabratus]KAH7606658.1 hypothetical protein J7293_01631 [Nakaseomyces glabratus]KAH7613525.1 hypothetical protein J7292_01625 [Nakaseomyces glabratus]|eukprot:XP_446382.1 uncharacterized protein CAGL0G00396g [[Candida] glabrata]
MTAESMIHRANKGGYGSSQDENIHYEYDWVRPVKVTENSQGGDGSDPLIGIGSESKESSFYGFKFKTWQKRNGGHPIEKDPVTLLNMDDFDRTKVSEKKKKLGKKLDGDDLSEDAIRGAVGGSDTVFSSSHAKPDTSGGMKRNETETEKQSDSNTQEQSTTSVKEEESKNETNDTEVTPESNAIEKDELASKLGDVQTPESGNLSEGQKPSDTQLLENDIKDETKSEIVEEDGNEVGDPVSEPVNEPVSNTVTPEGENNKEDNDIEMTDA